MRISDWSSDVCSSDLPGQRGAPGLVRLQFGVARAHLAAIERSRGDEVVEVQLPDLAREREAPLVRLARIPAQREPRFGIGEAALQQIGRASCRERVCQYV